MESDHIKALIERLEAISGEWDGDNPGIKEDRAHIAEEWVVHLKDLQEFLDQG